jgi:hypothetical protein
MSRIDLSATPTGSCRRRRVDLNNALIGQSCVHPIARTIEATKLRPIGG